MNVLLSQLLESSFTNRSLPEILAASPEALKDISAEQAAKLQEWFGITTIRELAESPVFQAARLLLAASGVPSFDPGPSPAWDTFFQQAPLGAYQAHNLPAKKAVFRTEFGPVFYRGRLDGTARVMLVGQDPSTDELLAARTLVGLSGQRIQGLLTRIGLNRSYVMVNTFLYGIHGQFTAAIRAISLEPAIRDYRNSVFDQIAADNPLQAIIAIGAGARHAIEHWSPPPAVPVFNVVHPSADESSIIQSWNQTLPQLIAAVTPDQGMTPDSTPYGAQFRASDMPTIPRTDLPFGIPSWHGSGGTRSIRSGDKKITWKSP
jgi:hypothetical protein